MLNQLFWIVPICSVIALLFAWFFFKGMMKESEGNETMKRIAGHVRKGAMAYLRQQYKIVGLVFLVLCLFFAWMAYGPGLQNGWVWFAFLTGEAFFLRLLPCRPRKGRRGRPRPRTVPLCSLCPLSYPLRLSYIKRRFSHFYALYY